MTKGGKKSTRWDVARLSPPAAVWPRPIRWRSYDLKGSLPRATTQALVAAVQSLPARGPWPDVDEDWWQAVLADRRRNDAAGQRLDRLPVKSLTFKCAWCGQRATLKVDDLIRMFGPDRNVRSIVRHVLNCRDKRSRREGEGCPITYQA
jgi:hypothetical protein